ncbi:hypothetical protein ACIHFE_19610 [Streptomyces sp. NPDC052396]|uniref:hypothetical protein n=1 Tax=Streptomyces sp. NPDC052396 TaxID=3365689 RepID=UPI0037CE4EB8
MARARSALAEYRRKRDFSRTAEPGGARAGSRGERVRRRHVWDEGTYHPPTMD